MKESEYTYLTITEEVEGIYREKGSKFIAYLYPVTSVLEIEDRLQKIKGAHPKARHVCYAYRLGIAGDPFRFNDDGEPSGTAGRPIFNELLSANISDVLCTAVRYFGGTKLGASGLIRAYQSAARSAIAEMNTRKITLTRPVCIFFKIEHLGKIYQILKNRGFTNIDCQYTPEPQCLIQVPLYQVGIIRRMILADYMGTVVEDITDEYRNPELRVEID